MLAWLRSRKLGSSLLLMCLCVVWQPGYSEDEPEAGKYNFMTSGGVSVENRFFSLRSVDIAVGSGEFPARLELVRKWGFDINKEGTSDGFGRGSSHSLALKSICFPCISGWWPQVLKILRMDTQHTFERSVANGPWVNHYKDGATVVDQGTALPLEARTDDGLRIVYAPTTGANALPCYGSSCRLPLLIENAAGDFLIYQYQTVQIQSAYNTSRITSVVNSRGFGLNFFYVNAATTSGDEQARFLINRIQAFRVGCVTSATVNCNAGPLPEVFYGYTDFGTDTVTGYKKYRLTSFTNAAGVTFNYAYDHPQFLMTSMRRADNPSVAYFTNTYDASGVSSQTDASGRTTTYNPNGDVVAPDGGVTHYEFVGTIGGPESSRIRNPRPRFVVTPLGHEYEHTYDNIGRLTSTIDPEGGIEQRTLDDRSNVTELRRKARTGSGLTDIVSTATFPACTTTNYRICNRPSNTVDARGGRSDFQYSETHGGILVALAPADADGKRAVRRVGYQSFYPVAGLSAPPGVTLPSNWKKTTDDGCLASGVTGTTVDFSYVCPAASRIRTSWRYLPSSSASPSSHELEASIVNDGGLTLETRYSYDRAGNLISERSPRAFQP